MQLLQKLKYVVIGGVLTFGILLTVIVWANSTTLTLATLSEFTQVFANIKNYYVDKVDDKSLIDDAIDGMLSRLDPHSVFLRPKAFDALKVSTKGQFGGLGIEVSMSEEGYVKVVSPIDDTPAFYADVRAGDLITKLDGKPVKGMSLSEAVDIMRGEEGKPIVISIMRKGEASILDKNIIRARIQIQSVRSKILEPDYGYVRISRFQRPTGEQLRKHILKLQKSQKNLEGIVLDLRNNPGGLLDSAVDVAGTFMNGGLVVATKGRIQGSDQNYNARGGELLKGKPIVVLINEGSASASEIVAGALQDTKRAIIMGRTSFGKGSVQSVLPIKNSKSALKLTTAKYYTPSGKIIQAKGIKPDIDIPVIKIEALENIPIRVKEKDLVGHIENEQDNKSKKLSKAKPKNSPPGTNRNKNNNNLKPVGASELIKTDYELYLALNMLKGLAFKQK